MGVALRRTHFRWLSLGHPCCFKHCTGVKHTLDLGLRGDCQRICLPSSRNSCAGGHSCKICGKDAGYVEIVMGSDCKVSSSYSIVIHLPYSSITGNHKKSLLHLLLPPQRLLLYLLPRSKSPRLLQRHHRHPSQSSSQSQNPHPQDGRTLRQCKHPHGTMSHPSSLRRHRGLPLKNLLLWKSQSQRRKRSQCYRHSPSLRQYYQRFLRNCNNSKQQSQQRQRLRSPAHPRHTYGPLPQRRTDIVPSSRPTRPLSCLAAASVRSRRLACSLVAWDWVVKTSMRLQRKFFDIDVTSSFH